MPRIARIDVGGYVYHVLNRANARVRIFDNDEDYKGTYILYVKAYEDGKEDEQCLSKFVELDVGRDKIHIYK